MAVANDSVDDSAFKGIAEIYFAQKLQQFVRVEIDNDRGGKIIFESPHGLGVLYESNEVYKSIVEASINRLQTQTNFLYTRTYSLTTSDSPIQLPLIRVNLSISNTAVMELAGTNAARISSLAF